MKTACPVRKEAWRKSAPRTRGNSPAAYLTLGAQDMAGEAALWLATGSAVGAGTYITPGVAAQAAIAISGPGRRHKKAQEACRAILLILQLLQDLAIQLRAGLPGPGLQAC